MCMRKLFARICVFTFLLTLSLSAHAAPAPSCPILTRQLSLGSRGTDVSRLQTFLREKSFFSPEVNTGYFGKLTQKAVIQFQRANGLDPVGIVGPKTRTKIGADCVTIPPPQTAQTTPESANKNPQTGILPVPTGEVLHGRSYRPADTPAPIIHTYTVGGIVNGLTSTDLVLQNNGADDLSLLADGSFTFGTPMQEGASYAITVSQQPTGQTCVITHSTGTMGGSNVTNIGVSCSATLLSITITPNNSQIPMTINEQFTAIGIYADSSRVDITRSVTWDTSDHGVATITGTGLGTGVDAGTAQVTATMDGVTGTTNLTVTYATLVSITVSPTNASLPAGINLQYGASGIFSDASTVDITDQVAWDTSDQNTATISSSGLATGVAAGTTQVSATLSGVTGNTNLAVTDAVLVAISVAPDNTTLPVGINARYTATGTFSDANTIDITNQATWNTSDPSVATISSTGSVTGVASGTTRISASLNAVSGSTNLTVTNAVLVAISVTPSNDRLPRGINSSYTAFGIFSDASTVDITNQVVWDTSSTNVATVDSTGSVTGVVSGTTRISASLNAVSGSTNLTVTSATLVSITISPSNPAVPRGNTIQLSALGTFSDGAILDITNQATWTSTVNHVAVVRNLHPRGQVTGVAGGSTSIHASLHSVTGTVTLFAGS